VNGKRALPLLALLVGAVFVSPQLAWGESPAPALSLNLMSGKEVSQTEVYTGLKLLVLTSALVFLPSLIMTATSFTRVAIVLSITRQALGTAQTPPNQIILGMSLFLTFAIMSPVLNTIYQDALVPYSEEKIGHEEALTKAFAPLKTFMLRHTREQDLELFMEITKQHNVETPEELGAAVVIPAFVISELNSAFQIAFLIYLPFLILDMIISSVLTSMSMITLPPTVISLPIKLMLFVVIDGWHLIIGNLVKSYHLGA
jgi:flagellar biosynthetic protein FliP